MTAYLLRYPDGNWVRRDDSTGPMSSGGYPSKVEDVHRATQFETRDKAIKYMASFKSENLTLMYVRMDPAEAIQPSPEEWAEATGDEQYKEYLRLAAIYGPKGECKFDKSWVGACKKETVSGSDYCTGHLKVKCKTCGAQATKDCDATIGAFVCGTPLCSKHRCHH